jgi:DNA-binding GntR family transcriptional regulator
LKKITEIRSPLLKDIAYDKIKECILDEYFQPGRFLSERELIEFLEMSKTPIKSALVRLETEGFVTVSSKQGIIINDLSIDKIRDIYNLRIALETYNCEQLIGIMTEEQLGLLEQNLKETEENVQRLNVKTFAKLDHAYHLLICNFTGNQEIYRVLLNYQDHLLRITLRHLKKDPYRMLRFFEEHAAIFEHLKKGSSQTVLLMKEHLQEAKRTLFI